MKRTDVSPIKYPKNILPADRRFARSFIVNIRSYINSRTETIIVACSGGIDSVVLAHALGQCLIISPMAVDCQATAVYVDHGLRPDETPREAALVQRLAERHLSYAARPIMLYMEDGPGVQERARGGRYAALKGIADPELRTSILTAHHADDNAETKIFQFFKGWEPKGISPVIWAANNLNIIRPMLGNTRAEIERYAKIWDLEWIDDPSNATDKYTRNKIRHHLIPWIKENINSGVVGTLNNA